MDRVKEDELILVDLFDREIGTGPKLRVHRENRLHRAFSVFILHEDRMLIQRRAFDKYHSGGLWSNACCSHQRKGEELEDSVHRRMEEELGFDCALEEKFDFVYRTQFREDLIEYEFDHVFVGQYSGDVRVDPQEASQIRWIALGELKEQLMKTPEMFSSWFLICAPKVIAYIERRS